MNSFAGQSDRWSFETWFTGFGNPDYIQFKEALVRDIERAKREALGVQNNTDKMISILCDFELLSERLEHLSSYLSCLFADNPGDEAIKLDKAWMATIEAEATKLRTSLQITLAHLSDVDFAAIVKNQLLNGAEHALYRMREEGQYKMNIEKEALVADLNVNGLHAWGRLYETLSSGMEFQMTFPDGHVETVPMARRRALMAEPNRFLRQAAFDEGQKPWNEHAETLAACLNGIAGTRLSLYSNRGIPHFLSYPLFENDLSQASLEAMLEAIHQNIELPRRALRAAAHLQGTPALHYCDLEAPQILPLEENALSWNEACTLLEESFSSTYPKLGQYFREMIKNRWIEAEGRSNKSSGAFCTHSRWKQEERVYMSFYGTLHDLVTLAHEVGHAWHSFIMHSKRSFASHYPMTLAETASNFGERILLNSLINNQALSSKNRGYLIDQEILRNHAYLINIPMRFDFEKAFYTERATGEVPLIRLCELMTQTQLEWYGDTLLAKGTDPMFWAYKMHFFLTDLPFYNFPYVFGYLLSQALHDRFKNEGAAFLSRYESFLADSGSVSCEKVAYNTLGVDLTNPDFWTSAIRTIEPTLQEYEALTE